MKKPSGRVKKIKMDRIYRIKMIYRIF